MRYILQPDHSYRIVLPKQLRRKLKICPADLLTAEIKDKKLVISKLNQLDSYTDKINRILCEFYKATHVPIMLCNTQNILAAYGLELSVPAAISEELEYLIQAGNACMNQEISLTASIQEPNAAVFPILLNNRPAGALVTCDSDSTNKLLPSLVKAAEVIIEE